MIARIRITSCSTKINGIKKVQPLPGIQLVWAQHGEQRAKEKEEKKGRREEAKERLWLNLTKGGFE